MGEEKDKAVVVIEKENIDTNNGVQINECIEDEWNSDGDVSGMIAIQKPNRDTINKVCIFSVLLIIAITSFWFSGDLIAQREAEEKLAEIEETKPVELESEPTPVIPVYSEEAKERLNNIYNYFPKNENSDYKSVDSLESEENGGSEENQGNQEVEKIAYLTFDDGPSASVTPQILEILRNERIKATFFVLGSRAELYPELVKQEYDEGHYIANHRIFT